MDELVSSFAFIFNLRRYNLDGEAHVRASLAMDAIAADLVANRPGTALAYLSSPGTAFPIPKAWGSLTTSTRPIRALDRPCVPTSRVRASRLYVHSPYRYTEVMRLRARPISVRVLALNAPPAMRLARDKFMVSRRVFSVDKSCLFLMTLLQGGVRRGGREVQGRPQVVAHASVAHHRVVQGQLPRAHPAG